MKLKVLASGAVLALTALSAAHAHTLTGCYVPRSGFANSQSTDLEQQIGSYKIVLTKKRGPLRQLVLRGPFKGKITESDGLFVFLDHVLGDFNLEGLISTQGDQGEITGWTDTTVDVIEVLNPVAGTGKFSGLIPGGTITLTGTLDSTTGTNTFDVVSGEGEVCFQ